MYDGTALTNANWNYNSTGNDGFVAGQGFATATANGTITNVGSTDNTFAYTLTAATNPLNYTVNVTEGKLTITASDALTVDATDVIQEIRRQRLRCDRRCKCAGRHDRSATR